MIYYQAITARTTSLDSRFARRHPGTPTTPLIHAIHPDLPKASRTGHNYKAVCGASVAVVLDGNQFYPGNPRACRNCVKAVA